MAIQSNWELGLKLELQADDESDIATLLRQVAMKIRDGKTEGVGNFCAGAYMFELTELRKNKVAAAATFSDVADKILEEKHDLWNELADNMDIAPEIASMITLTKNNSVPTHYSFKAENGKWKAYKNGDYNRTLTARQVIQLHVSSPETLPMIVIVGGTMRQAEDTARCFGLHRPSVMLKSARSWRQGHGFAGIARGMTVILRGTVAESGNSGEIYAEIDRQGLVHHFMPEDQMP